MNRQKPDCLVFKTSGGDQIPCSAESVTLELVGDAATMVDKETIREAAAAVLHYFKHEQNREFVSVAEFAEALERALQGVGLTISTEVEAVPPRVLESDLTALLQSSGGGGELFFFPQLRLEVARHLGESPQVVRFRGLQTCVKQLAGTARWSQRCEKLSDQIVDYIRTCWQSDARSQDCTLVVN